MHPMKTFIIYLTIALVGVGLTVLISERVKPLEGQVYADSRTYNESMRQAIEDGDVPEMPACAETIQMKEQEETVIAIHFICADVAARDAYIAFIKREYAWDITAVDDDRVRLELQVE